MDPSGPTQGSVSCPCKLQKPEIKLLSAADEQHVKVTQDLRDPCGPSADHLLFMKPQKWSEWKDDCQEAKEEKRPRFATLHNNCTESQ